MRVPASSANLGPAFDALAIALGTHLTIRPGAPAADETHPAVRAFRAAGGRGTVAVDAAFPGGRGLGFSAAARVAGMLGAALQQDHSIAASRERVLHDATELEGHADNVAASLHGGVVAVAGGRVARVPVARDAAVVVWVPARETSTRASRRRLPARVSFDDAVFNIGRTALLVAALASGDVDVLRDATADRLHQDHRLQAVPETRNAMRGALDAGAWCSWLSGSGPSAAALVDVGRADAVARALPDRGRALVLPIDQEGATSP